MTRSHSAMQWSQHIFSAVLLVLNVALLASIFYVFTVPVQFYADCLAGDYECESGGLTMWVYAACVGCVVAQLALVVILAPRWALDMAVREPSDAPLERRLPRLAAHVAESAGMCTPVVKMVNDMSLNAFAAWNRGQPTIIVTSALAASLDDRQMTGVLAHEVAHLKNRDAQVTWMTIYGSGVIAVLASFLMMAGWASTDDRNSDESDGGMMLLIGGLLWIVALPAALLVRATLSRRREQLADATAVLITRDPGGLRQALERMTARRQPTGNVRTANAALWICDPQPANTHRGGASRWLASHPPVEERIAWLRSVELSGTDWLDRR
jgi:heat shock protein HtpX